MQPGDSPTLFSDPLLFRSSSLPDHNPRCVARTSETQGSGLSVIMLAYPQQAAGCACNRFRGPCIWPFLNNRWIMQPG